MSLDYSYEVTCGCGKPREFEAEKVEDIGDVHRVTVKDCSCGGKKWQVGIVCQQEVKGCK